MGFTVAKVLNCGNPGEQHSVFLSLRSQMVPNRLNLAHWRPRNFHPLDLIGQGVIASPNNGVFVRQPCSGLQGNARWRLMRPPRFHTFVFPWCRAMCARSSQLTGEDTVEFANSLGKAHRVEIVVESKQVFTFVESLVNCSGRNAEQN